MLAKKHSPNFSNPFLLLSKYRTQLMGFAILWVICSHIAIPIVRTTFLLKIGYAGADIFLFLSGFGLYYSSLKKQSKTYFYLKRLLRIYPIYILCIVLFHYLQSNDSLFVFLMRASTLSFWLNFQSFEWFIPSLLLLYLLFPYYSRVFNKSPYWVTALSVLFGITVSILFACYYGNDPQLMFLTRIPIFALGVLMGFLSLKTAMNQRQVKLILYSMAFIGLIVLRLSFKFFDPYLSLGLYWLPFICITPGLTIFIASILNRLGENNYLLFSKISNVNHYNTKRL